MNQRDRKPRNESNDPSTGSSRPGEPVFLAVGRLRRPHGIHGEILMDVLTGFPERIFAGKVVFAGDTREPIEITGVRGTSKEMIVRLKGYDTPETVGRFRNMIVFVKSSDLPELPEGEYYHHQLLGLTVVDEAGEVLGKLVDILETGANDVYTVRSTEGKELLLPAVEEVVLDVNLEKGEMRVRQQNWD